MSSFKVFLKEINDWAVWAANLCDHFEDESGNCHNCPCVKIGDENGRCTLNLSNWLKGIQYEEWAQKLIEDANYLNKPNIAWETERRQLIENCDRLAAENCQLTEEIESMKKAAFENQVLRTRLTQEALSNLEMKIMLDLQELYREDRERNADIYSED